MRLKRIVALGGAMLALGACDDSLAPPLIVEPAEGAVVDRALVRVRTTSPDDLYSAGIGTGEFSTEIKGHVNWRLAGGPITEVQFPTVDRDDRAPFMFGATIAPGTNQLEVGACDSFDACSWTPRSITLAPHSGSPDPTFAGTGQLVLADYDRTAYPTPLADGRVLLGIEDQTVGAVLIALRADGTLDKDFGDSGAALLPVYLGPAFRVLPQPEGGFLVFLIDRIIRLTASGALDPTFGVDGVVALAAPNGVVRSVTAFAPDRTGAGYTLTGVTQLDPLDFNDIEGFVTHVDASGMQTIYVVPDATGGPFRATAVDADGVVIRLGADLIRLDTITGPVASFGTAGSLQLPAGTGATNVIFHADGLAVGAHAGGALSRALFVSRLGVVGASLELPFERSSDPLIASAPDGSLYVAGPVAHPMEAASLVRDGIDGSDLGVVRILDGALDGSFGDAGIAHASFMLARKPIVLETIIDHPIVLTIGADNEPWVSGLSSGIETAERAWLRRVDRRTILVRFLP